MPPDPDAVRRAIVTATRLEKTWSGKIPGTDPRYLPFMPFSIPAFIALLAEALPEAPGSRFLDIGCGPGTKMLIAQDLFGLHAVGIDRVPEYVTAARLLGLNASEADAADYGNYAGYDILWFYRPIRDPGLQAALEKTVWDQMAPGAVVIGANLEAPPPDHHVILDDWERKRGIWMRPPLR
jgi:trans-aconitate methyltransferase